MDEIDIPYHLAIPTFFSFGFVLFILWNRNNFLTNNSRKLFWLSTLVFFSIYALIVGGAMIYDLYCQWDLNNYDLDKDGFFSGVEITKEQEAAMFRLTSDVGRNFTIFTGLIFSFIISIPVYFIGSVFQKIKENRK